MLDQYIIITLVVGIIIAAILMLVRVVFYSQIKRVADEKNAEIMNWFLYQEMWDGNPNTILYSWRKVLYELRNTHAPRVQIEAAERQLKYYERKMTKSTWLVNSKGLTSKTTVGGEYAH
ncbi:hypothetical protein [Gracilimonas tropica]|uniref:hypothetical protein n=1 Tax=Gracilimonas tropica TaxID=454600 RepID=UPI0003807123|nr:hypothetical protein [Gracilimonas tropica]